jgi:hypothetical protein
VRIIDEAEVRDRATVDAVLVEGGDPPSPDALDSALWICVERGWELLAEQVLAAGPPLTSKPSQSRHVSILSGAVELLPSFVPKLLAAGAAPSAGSLAEAIRGFLYPDRRASSLQNISQLLAAGAVPTAQHLYEIIKARPQPEPDLVQSFVASGAPVDEPDDWRLSSGSHDSDAKRALPLHGAISSGCGVEVLSVLLKAGAPVDQTHGNKNFPSHDKTALYHAVAEGNLPAVCFLLKEGADVTRVFSDESTLLYLLSQSRHISAATANAIAEVLLEHGAPCKGLSTLRCRGVEWHNKDVLLPTAFERTEEFDRPQLAATLRSAVERADGEERSDGYQGNAEMAP